jgi:hypothetical protein
MADQPPPPPPPRIIPPPPLPLGAVDVNRLDVVQVPSTKANIYQAVEILKNVERGRGTSTIHR